MGRTCTVERVDVPVSELRAHLSEWLARAGDGEEIVVTDRGVPVARLTGIDSRSKLEQLVRDGVVARPASRASRPRAAGQPRPKARRSVAERVSADRR
jgi:prevent-host-death family protein